MCGELGEPAAALEIEVPAIGPLSAFSLPLPVTVINWPDTLKPVPAAPLTEEERVTPADEDSDIDEEFAAPPEPTIVWPDLPKIQIPKIQIPDIVAAAMPPDPDAGALARILGLIGGGRDPRSGRTRRLRDRGDPVPDLEPSDGRRAEWLISSSRSAGSRQPTAPGTLSDLRVAPAPEPLPLSRRSDHPPVHGVWSRSDRSSRSGTRQVA